MMESENRRVAFSIPGEPQGKVRTRGVNGYDDTPKRTMSYEAGIVLAYRNRYADRVRWEKGVPLRMRITAFYEKPEGAGIVSRADLLRLRPTKRPNADNIGKIVTDALNGIAYYDDAQIVDLQVRKVYADHPQVIVEIVEEEEII